MAFDFTDQFLARHVTPERTAQASADVDSIGQFPDPWRDRLVVLRAYILICLDSLKGGIDDLYQAKLTAYRKEFELALVQARAIDGVTVDPEWPAMSVDGGRR